MPGLAYALCPVWPVVPHMGARKAICILKIPISGDRFLIPNSRSLITIEITSFPMLRQRKHNFFMKSPLATASDNNN